MMLNYSGIFCYVQRFHVLTNTITDLKRDLLKQAPYPEDSKSPHDFDSYTLNHAAKVNTCFNSQSLFDIDIPVGGYLQS